ncbi:hypothetical protein Fmac_028855 [Flemingia macrophylla]|uniref:Fungal lipase-type domain-containing protein n=1 Tax=Flemingia macrophylla TaxID=520843 RepID=A0ABD1L8N9_9FABA
MVIVVSFGGPRVGNESFMKQLEQNGIKILRIVNVDDVVTKVPWLVVNLEDMTSSEDAQLRLSSKELPYLNKGDVAMSHDLKTYLHLVKIL